MLALILQEILLTNTYPRKGKLHVHLLILKFIYELYVFYFVLPFVVVVVWLVFVVGFGLFFYACKHTSMVWVSLTTYCTTLQK